MDLSNIVGLTLINALIILFVINEDGPMNMFRGIRYYMGVNQPIEDIEGDVVEYISNGKFLGDVFSCYKCFGFWSGLLISMLYIAFSGDLISLPIIMYGGIFGAKQLQ